MNWRQRIGCDHISYSGIERPGQNSEMGISRRERKIEEVFPTFTLKPDGAIDHFTMVAVSPLADFSFDY